LKVPIFVVTEVATMKLGPLVIRPGMPSSLAPGFNGTDVAYYFRGIGLTSALAA